MPKTKTPKPKPLYRRKNDVPIATGGASVPASRSNSTPDVGHAIPASHFKLKDDGTIQSQFHRPTDDDSPSPGGEGRGEGELSVPKLIFSHDAPFVRLYHGNSLELLDAIAAKYPEGRFDAIFADPPYFLSNGGITCHAGCMVKVDKGDWDKSRGPELNHEFNKEWLARCQKVLKPNGTIWVSGTHHVIFSIGYAMQQLGYKILNDIAWEKPNPPPNLSCRYFTHSTETILWAARDEKSKHKFNYQEMRKVTGKQMKTVWRGLATESQRTPSGNESDDNSVSSEPLWQSNVWTLSAPGNDEKQNGKHPTQKPLALLERCISASTNEGDLVLDPFLGGGTTAVACVRLKRGCVGIELDFAHLALAAKRADREIISIWLRHFRVTFSVVPYGRDTLPCVRPPTVSGDKPLSENPKGIQSISPVLAVKRPTLGKHPHHSPNSERVESSHSTLNSPNSQLPKIDLDLFPNSINGSRVDDKPQVPTERIFHECKFVFLSCAEVERGAVVHTTVDVSLQEAWAKTPNGKKRETTHVVRCETEIFRVKSN